MFDCLQRRRIHGSKILHIRHHEMCSVLFIYDFVAFFLIILRLRRCILLRLIKKDQITDEYQEIELWRQHLQKTKTMFNSIWLNNSQVLSNSEYCRLLGIDNYKQYFTYDFETSQNLVLGIVKKQAFCFNYKTNEDSKFQTHIYITLWYANLDKIIFKNP